MTKYINTTSATTEVLLKKNIDSGDIRSIVISNQHASTSQDLKLQLHDGSSATILYRLDIPPKAAIVLKEGIRFDNRTYRMEVVTTTSADTQIIIE